MRLTIEHETHYRYEVPPRSVIDVLRLTPCSFDAQSVRSWRIEVTGDARLHRFDDAFGNINHTFTLADPGETLTVRAIGTVETEPSNGVVSGAREPLPTGVFLRQSELTEPSAEMDAFVAEARQASDGTALDLAHTLNVRLNQSVAFEAGQTDVATPAAAAFAAGHGVCQDLTHILVGAAREANLPARYVSGYQFQDGGAREDHAGHAWAELFIEGLGWVGFDPTAGRSIDDTYVRVAVGIDATSAAPVRGATVGGAGETLTVSVTMDQGSGRVDRQTQTMGGMRQTQGPGSQSQNAQ